MRMWRKETLRKAMRLLLCLVMVLGMLPVPSFAAEGEPCALTADCAGFYDAEGMCTVCGLVELPEHTHVYNGEAFYSQKDDNVHAVTRACTGCEEKPTETVDETHTYIEGVCVCGKEAPAPDHTHVYDGEAFYAPKDENVHVVTRVCTGCEEKPTQAADENHTYEDGVCACGMPEPAKEPECNCGVKCDKEFQDEECPVCSMGDYADCVGNEISAFLSGNYTGNGTMQYNQGDTTIDVQGAGGVQTTYSNYGYYLKTTNNLSGKVAASATFANGGSYVKLSYTVTNDTGSQITGDVGICADVQIGSDDKATITAIKNAEGSMVIGLKMVDTNETGQLQFNLYFRNAAGVTDADRYWIGAYSGGDYKNHWNDDSTAESFSGQDSALAVSWDVSLAPGESKTYSVIVGVGEVADPPQFEDNGVALTMSAEATPDNLLIHVNAKVKDASGVTDSLYYNENGGAEQQLGNPVISDGESEKEITGVIDLTKKPDGTYKYQFWIVNSKGATSEVVERTITITNGKVTGDVTEVTNKYNVRVVTPSNGSLSANGSIVESGTEITVTFAPAEGYELDELTITDKNGDPVGVTATGNTRTFTMPASNVTVTATFKQSTVPVTGITVNPPSLTMSVDDTVSLVTEITPSNATHQELEWSSDNAAVATVDENGKISAVGSGEATITVKAKDGSNTSATCAVHVHGWNYQVEDGTLDTITAKCGVGSCAENGGTLTIIKPALTVYGGTGSKDAVLNASENSVFDAANLSIRYRVKDGAEQNAAPTDAGTYVASVTAGNATARVEYTIAKAALTITADSPTITYGDAAPAYSVTGSGFQFNDDLTSLDAANAAVTCSYQQYDNAGTYDIVPGGYASNNYEITYVNGTLTVGQKEIGIQWSTEPIIFKENTEQAPTATATALVAEDVCTITVDGSQINAGTYTATAISLSNPNYKLPDDVTTEFTIRNADQAKPTGVVGVGETIREKGDGKITGVDSTMEYRAEGESAYTAITGDKVTNLAAGTYYVRKAAKTNYNASEDAEVTVSEGPMLKIFLPPEQIGYTIITNLDEIAYGGTVTLTYRLAAGYTEGEHFAVTASNGTVTDNRDGTYTISEITEDTTVSVTDVSDVTAPTAEITVATNQWTEFLNTITFDLFFKQTQTVTITAEDEGSGVASIEYYLSNAAMTLDQVKTITIWSGYNGSFSIDAENRYIIYAKVTDRAQNILYISSDGIILDKTQPVISGVTNGAVYYTTQKVTATDNTVLDTLTGTNADGTIPGDPAQETEHTIVATDKAGNSTTFKITMRPISSLAAGLPTEDTVELTDKDAIETIKANASDVLTNQSAHATDTEKAKLDAIILECKDLLDQIRKAEAVIALIQALPDAAGVEPDHKTAIDAYDAALAAYNDPNLPASSKRMVGEENKSRLDAVGKALTAYDIIRQSSRYYVKGSGKILTFTANGYYAQYGSYAANAYGKFVGVEVDGKAVDAKNYTAKAGSTVITLKSSYLDSLSTGKHTIKINYIDGSTDGEDTFRISINNGNPFTGDDTHMMFFTGMAMTSLLGMVMMVMFAPKKKGKYQR